MYFLIRIRVATVKVAMVREKILENEFFSRSGKSQAISFSVREIQKKMKKKSGNFQKGC